ncbi:MAG TPA: sugar phosphate isomerase/epimerase [Planctomycetaceae bacterium]|nr:sugar phosphate isomerase/epimerase [Planctomycetaceae bacterium]HRF00473.1 sugar phosphate isomerase/epimerase family protein [Pirellulaceae bacterium]
MRLGYVTNGFAHHDPLDAISILGALGYRSVALSIDHGTLAPGRTGPDDVARLRDRLAEYDLGCVIETGARFLLDPWLKHEPTLVSSTPEARRRRVDFLRYAIDTAVELGAPCVSLWAGIVRDGAESGEVLDRLANGLEIVCRHADQAGIDIGFEPEPGMAIDTMGRFSRLLEWFDAPRLKLTLDIGHLYCQGEVPLADPIRRWADRLVNIHLEDMRAGVHEHLMFGEGEIAFAPVLNVLREIDYRGPVHVELSRHAHEAVEAAKRAIAFLTPLWPADR